MTKLIHALWCLLTFVGDGKQALHENNTGSQRLEVKWQLRWWRNQFEFFCQEVHEDFGGKEVFSFLTDPFTLSK